MTTARMIVTTYGPLKGGGFGHDAETPSAITINDRVSTRGGVNDFETLLREAVIRYDLKRGDLIKVTITPIKKINP